MCVLPFTKEEGSHGKMAHRHTNVHRGQETRFFSFLYHPVPGEDKRMDEEIMNGLCASARVSRLSRWPDQDSF